MNFWLNRILSIWSFTGIVLLLAHALYYLLWPGFIDHAGEVTMASVSWLVSEGQPLYTPLDAPERYSLEHGPLLFIFMGTLMKSLGPSYLTAKLAGFIPLTVGLIISWFWFRHFLDRQTAFWLLGMESWLLAKWYYLYLARADGLLLLCVLLSLVAVTLGKNKWLTLLFVTLPISCLVDLKAHEVLFALPILIFIQYRFGWFGFFQASILLFLFALSPFLLPNISCLHYLQWLRAAAVHGISLKIALGNFSMLLLMGAIPLLVSALYPHKQWQLVLKQNKLFWISVAFAMIITAIVGAKEGSGSHHLAPVLPFMLYLVMQVIQKGRKQMEAMPAYVISKFSSALIIVIVVIISVSAVNAQQRIIRYTSAELTISQAMLIEAKSLQEKYAGYSMMVGYGDGHKNKLYNQLIPHFVFSHNPYFLDSAALSDMNFSGILLPQATRQYFKTGMTQVWLIPTGEKPFALGSGYNGAPLFTEEFRQTFNENYRCVERTHYFDVWLYTSHGKE